MMVKSEDVELHPEKMLVVDIESVYVNPSTLRFPKKRK